MEKKVREVEVEVERRMARDMSPVRRISSLWNDDRRFALSVDDVRECEVPGISSINLGNTHCCWSGRNDKPCQFINLHLPC